MDGVLEACAQLKSFGQASVLRQHITKSARNIFQAVMTGIMVREGESFLPEAVCSDVDEPADEKTLLEHVRSFAAQAMEQKRLLSFRFSYRSAGGESVTHGLAQPMATTETAAVLLAVRNNAFSDADVSAFSVLGNMARQALENSELRGFYSGKKQELDQLLEISAELGASSQLKAFFPVLWCAPPTFLAFLALLWRW
jgi:hypothetical protein